MPRRCAACGFRSDADAFFRREEGGLLGLRETVCEGCRPYQPGPYERRFALRLAFAQVFWALPIYLMFSHGVAQGLLFIVMIVAALMSMPLRIMVHEAGHTLAARVVGRDVYEVTIGRGPAVVARRLWGIPVEVRRYSFAGGRMRCVDLTDRPSRWRDAVILIAGPGANALCAGLLVAGSFLMSKFPTPLAQTAMAALAGMGVSQAATAMYNLIPRRFGDDETVSSDGRQLLSLLRPRPPANPAARAWLKTHALTRCGRHEEAAATALAAPIEPPYGVLLLSLALHNISRSRGDQAALECYALHAPGLPRGRERDGDSATSYVPWLQANVAWSAIKAAGGPFDGFIEPFSRAAIEAVPDAPEMKGTRGAWMVLTGRVDEGLPLLTDAVRTIADHRDRADYCSFLARGWRERGDEVRAAAFEHLRRHYPARV